MAGDWIPWVKGLTRKLEVLTIAERTNRSPREVAAILMEFWEWADTETEDGLLRGISLRSLSASHADMDGTFVRAMSEVGWLFVRESGALEIPNFERWMGRSAKRRLKETERRRQNRLRAPQVTVEPGERRSVSACDADILPPNSGTTEQNRTEQRRKETPTPFPTELDTAEFRAAWKEWEQHRAEKQKRLTPLQVGKQLKKLVPLGVPRAIAAIEHSIASGYQGIFEDKEVRHGQSGSRSGPGVGRPDRLGGQPGKYDHVPLLFSTDTSEGPQRPPSSAPPAPPRADQSRPAEGAS